MRLVGQAQAWDPTETARRRAEKASVAIPNERVSISHATDARNGCEGDSEERRKRRAVCVSPLCRQQPLTRCVVLRHAAL